MKELRMLAGSSEQIGEIPSIEFGILEYDEAEGNACRVISLHHVQPDAFFDYVAEVEAIGYVCRERRSLGDSKFYTLVNKDVALFLNFYPGTGRMRIVGEKNSGYICWEDGRGKWQVSSLLTQIDLEDYGLSYVIRMSDGRFLILDGGREFIPEADKLMKCLREQTLDEKPVIAAWIFTHPHIDHYRCFLTFSKLYGDQVIIEHFLYNFPELTEELTSRNPKFLEEQETEALQILDKLVAQSSVPVVRPHTGQIYQFSEVKMEVLSSLDDTCYPPCSVNATSLVLRMYIEGQSILFCGDSQLEPALLAERYGTYLKSDLLQVTHHGFNGGCVKAYGLIAPEVCLVPVSENLFYGYMGYYREDNKALLYDLDVKEIITGSHGDQVLELPYQAKRNGRFLLLDKAKEWQNWLGARSWVFSDLAWDTCRFSILNATFGEGTVRANLYFEDKADTIRGIVIKVPGYTVKRVDFTDESSIDPDAFFFNRASLVKMGIPEGKMFSVHFITDRPLVIWGEKKPVYVGV